MTCFVAPFGGLSSRMSLFCASRPASCALRRDSRISLRRQVPRVCCPRACADAVSDGPEDTVPALSEELKLLRWSEVPFESLEHELAAIDEYAREEGLSETNPWARFLRGAAYEHWGQPRLALAQYDLLDGVKGMSLVPDLWMRRAYNSFRIGEVVVADRCHDVAEMIRAEALGNQLHFTFTFEEKFRQHMPKHNGPSFALQRAICNYCTGRVKLIRTNIIGDIIAKSVGAEDLYHSCLWFLASSALSKSDEAVAPESLAELDRNAASDVLGDAAAVGPALAKLGALYSGEVSVSELVDEVSSRKEPPSLLESLYIALYYSAFEKNSEERDKWLDIANSTTRPVPTWSTEDYLWCAAKNRLTVPPDAMKDPPPAAVPI